LNIRAIRAIRGFHRRFQDNSFWISVHSRPFAVHFPFKVEYSRDAWSLPPALALPDLAHFRAAFPTPFFAAFTQN
jgi:hypothetical protein